MSNVVPCTMVKVSLQLWKSADDDGFYVVKKDMFGETDL